MLDKSTAVSDTPALPWGERDTTLEQIGRMGQDAVRWSLSHLLKEGGIVKIDRWYPSSKTCYNCKHVVEDLPLHLVCQACTYGFAASKYQRKSGGEFTALYKEHFAIERLKN